MLFLCIIYLFVCIVLPCFAIGHFTGSYAVCLLLCLFLTPVFGIPMYWIVKLCVTPCGYSQIDREIDDELRYEEIDRRVSKSLRRRRRHESGFDDEEITFDDDD